MFATARQLIQTQRHCLRILSFAETMTPWRVQRMWKMRCWQTMSQKSQRPDKNISTQHHNALFIYLLYVDCIYIVSTFALRCFKVPSSALKSTWGDLSIVWFEIWCFVCFFVCLFGWLMGWLVDWLIGCGSRIVHMLHTTCIIPIIIIHQSHPCLRSWIALHVSSRSQPRDCCCTQFCLVVPAGLYDMNWHKVLSRLSAENSGPRSFHNLDEIFEDQGLAEFANEWISSDQDPRGWRGWNGLGVRRDCWFRPSCAVAHGCQFIWYGLIWPKSLHKDTVKAWNQIQE